MKLFDKFVGESLIKEFEIGKLKFLVRIISKKEYLEAVNESLKKENIIAQSEDLKIRILAKSLIKIDDEAIEKYDEIANLVNDKVDVVEATVQFLASLPNCITDSLLLKYKEVEDKYSQQYDELKKN